MIQTEKASKFIEKSKKIHGEKYDYSKVNYTRGIEPVEIMCKKHGAFLQPPSQHLCGYGCNKCGVEARAEKRRMGKDIFVERAKEIHGDFYNYSKVEYSNNRTPVTIVCPIHGDFEQAPYKHISGSGCIKCAKQYSPTTDEFISMAKGIHGDSYDFSKVQYVSATTPVTVVCPIHGEFTQRPANIVRGYGCFRCGVEKRAKTKTLTNEEFISAAEEVHVGLYDYSKTTYTGHRSPVEIVCKKHGTFSQNAGNHLSGHGCPSCTHHVSSLERELSDYLEGLGVFTENNRRDLLESGVELDIFLPDHSLAFEINGLYWHSDKFATDNYHLNKTLLSNKVGVNLIHIFEDEWRNKKEIVKSIINSLLHKNNVTIYARQCEVKNVPTKEAMDFLESNHIQGKLGAAVKYGLYFNNELVSLMTFGNLRRNLGSTPQEGSFELLRFCNKVNTSVVGGASRMFTYFVAAYRPSYVVSYADRRWFTGKVYENMGFAFVKTTPSGYFYVEGNRRVGRYKYRKSELVKMGYSTNKTERQITKEMGLYRIYDCGMKKYEWKKV